MYDYVDEPVCVAAGRFGDFPAVFAFGFEPGQGPGLIFVVLPAVL